MTRLAALNACGVVALLAVGRAWQAAPQGPLFRASIDLVQVDVSVLDKNRQPVRGLTAADFAISEDGRPQPVVAFVPVSMADPPPMPVVAGQPVTWLRDVAPDVQTNDVAAGRLIVLVIDDALIPLDEKIVENAKRAARAVVDRLGPADRLSIAFTEDGRLAAGFTNDRAKLLAVVDRMHAGRAAYTFGWESIREKSSIDPGAADSRFQNPHPATDPDSGARDGSFDTLRMVADSLSAAPQRRKAIILISPGLPLNSQFASHPVLQAHRTMGNREANLRIAEQMPDLFRRMQQSNIVVYSIDPSGQSGIGPYVERALDRLPVLREYTPASLDPSTQEAPPAQPGTCDNAISINRPPCFVPAIADLAHFVARLGLDFLETAAANTGGRAIVNTDEFESGISQIFAENGSYYLLGFRAPAGDRPGSLHRVAVTVDRPGLDVRTRTGYSTPDPAKMDPTHAELSPAVKALSALLPTPDLPLEAVLAPVASGKSDPVVVIVLQLQRPAPRVPISDTLDIEVRAFTPEGAPRGAQARDVFTAIRPSTSGDIVRYEALSSIALKPGRYQLRIAAYSSTSDAVGSVFADVDVPDFDKEPVSLSGVFLTATPGLPVSPADLLAKIVPVVPTAARAFQKLDRVTAFVRVYQAVKAPAVDATMTARVTNDRGEAVVSQTDAIAAGRFASPGRAVDYRFDLPIVTLARGPYLLTLEAAAGATTARRDVKFSVR